MSHYRLGRVGGLELQASNTAAPGLVILRAAFSGIAIVSFRVSPVSAVAGGLIAAVLHFASEVAHNSGHARAARSTGHPMTGIRLYWVLGTSLYPDEPSLAPAVHVRRALGGPAASAIVTIVFGALALLMNGGHVSGAWVPTALFFDNLLVFTLGAFLPLGFTDGSTLLRWLPRLRDGVPAAETSDG